MDVVPPLAEVRQCLFDVAVGTLNDKSAVVAKDVLQITQCPDIRLAKGFNQVRAGKKGDADLLAITTAPELIDLAVKVVQDLGGRDIRRLLGLPGVDHEGLPGVLDGQLTHFNSRGHGSEHIPGCDLGAGEMPGLHAVQRPSWDQREGGPIGLPMMRPGQTSFPVRIGDRAKIGAYNLVVGFVPRIIGSHSEHFYGRKAAQQSVSKKTQRSITQRNTSCENHVRVNVGKVGQAARNTVTRAQTLT